MNNLQKSMEQRTYALIAGLSLLVMTVCAIFAQFSIFGNLIIDGDDLASANNLLVQKKSFLLAVIAFGFIIILDIVIALALCAFFKTSSKRISFIAACLRVVYALVFAYALSKLISVFSLLPLLKEAGQEQAAQIMFFINRFNHFWDIAFIFFGIHLLLLGYLALNTRAMFKLYGYLLIVSGLGYLFDSFGKFFVVHYSLEVTMYTFIGELVFMFWLLIKGGKS